MGAAALVLRGADAQLNFPNLASSLPRPHDLTDKSIQAAAIEAAQSFSRQMRSHTRETSRYTDAYPTIPTVVSQAAAHASNYSTAAVASITGYLVELRDPTLHMSRAMLPPEPDNAPPMSPNCEADFDRAITRVSDSSASTPDYDAPDDTMATDPRPEVDSEIRSPHHASSNFMEVDMMYTMADPHHPSSIDSDDGTSYAWEPRLWSF